MYIEGGADNPVAKLAEGFDLQDLDFGNIFIRRESTDEEVPEQELNDTFTEILEVGKYVLMTVFKVLKTHSIA